MGKASTGSNVGTGGMNTKMIAAENCHQFRRGYAHCQQQRHRRAASVLEGENEGTLFVAHRDESFDLPEFVQNLHKN